MAPNLLVATQTLFTPHRWFSSRSNKPGKPARKVEHWASPVPGVYEYIPGRGWYLVARDDEDQRRLEKPIPVKYSRVLRRDLLQPEYDNRCRHGIVKDSTGKVKELGFFRLDNGVAWVNCWDTNGAFIPGPYKMWCIDKDTQTFREMLKGDDPEWCSRRSSRSGTEPPTRPASLRDPPSQPNSRPGSTLNLPLTPTSTRPDSLRMNSSHRDLKAKSSGLSGEASTAGPLSQSSTHTASSKGSNQC